MQTNPHTAAVYPPYRGTPPLPYELAFEDDTYYPESDGQPMAETELHRDLMIDSILTLKARFQDIPDVCVSGNMLMYYAMKDAKKSLAPDVFVTFGIERKQRRIYRLWEEGKPPDFVLEFSSENTFKRGLRGQEGALRRKAWCSGILPLRCGPEVFTYAVDGLSTRWHRIRSHPARAGWQGFRRDVGVIPRFTRRQFRLL